MHRGGGDSDGDVGIDDVGGVNTDGGDDANFVDSGSKFDCGDDIDGDNGDDKDNASLDDDGDIDSNIGNDTKCGDGRSKVDRSEDTAGDDGNSNADGGPNHSHKKWKDSLETWAVFS